MDHCPVHPMYFKTANTPCPACRDDFDNDIPAGAVAKPADDTKWLRELAAKHVEKAKEQQDVINDLRRDLSDMAILAVIGWSLTVVTTILTGLGVAVWGAPW